ncbi:hypothetical protein N658DRAFT_268373 [Parathielavia hyrcaniae]|uniref:Uncharacterized protein n=1 Tax=Parathielavia hyrcaniae TaxID=113614 RepID=A0AAN6SYK2_9PEZI|nr:hypothetical protein N658DRAFT_268373 [Parathielavia hyrcaniae]
MDVLWKTPKAAQCVLLVAFQQAIHGGLLVTLKRQIGLDLALEDCCSGRGLTAIRPTLGRAEQRNDSRYEAGRGNGWPGCHQARLHEIHGKQCSLPVGDRKSFTKQFRKGLQRCLGMERVDRVNGVEPYVRSVT